MFVKINLEDKIYYWHARPGLARGYDMRNWLARAAEIPPERLRIFNYESDLDLDRIVATEDGYMAIVLPKRCQDYFGGCGGCW